MSKKCGFKLRSLINCNDCGYRVPTTPVEFSSTEIYFLLDVCPYCKSEDISVLLDPKPILSKDLKLNPNLSQGGNRDD
jgi:Zn finger protein HypA/HybF involved in hydrogenase expression